MRGGKPRQGTVKLQNFKGRTSSCFRFGGVDEQNGLLMELSSLLCKVLSGICTFKRLRRGSFQAFKSETPFQAMLRLRGRLNLHGAFNRA